MLNCRQPGEYREKGAVAIRAAPVEDYLPFLREQLAAISQPGRKKRPWLLWELHNPWSRSASVADSWKFLELCQSETLLSHIAPLMGEDIILFDSQFSPDLRDAGNSESSWQNDRLRCPASPLQGLVARIPFACPANESARFIYQPGPSAQQAIEYRDGAVLCHNIDLNYRIVARKKAAQQPWEYVIRYFPATSRYLRDPATEFHSELTERYPLLNYAKMPLWLVRGDDRAGNDFVTGFQPKAGRWIDRPGPPAPAESG